MPTDITYNSLTATIPALGDTANIVTAFDAYHTDISAGVAVLGKSNTFGAAAGSNQIIKTASSGYFEVSTVNASKYGVSLIATDNAGYPIILRPYLAGTAQSSSDFYYNGTADRWVSEVPLYSNIVTRAGTSSEAPITITSGTNLSTIAAGSIEYDGNLFYATPKVNNTTAGRGLLPAQNVFKLFANNTQSVSSAGATITTDFYALNKSIYLAASQAYFVEMSIRVYHNLTYAGSGAGSITFLLKAPTNSSFEFDTQSQVDMATLATAGTPTFEYLSGLGVSKTIKSGLAASDTGYSIFKWSGIVYVGTTAGNFGPAFTLSATGSGTTYTTQMVVQAGSYCKVTPLGTYSADINIGGWA